MRQATVLTLLVAAIMAVALFFVKYEVTSLEQELEGLNKNIVVHHEAIHVLKAEWSHLNNIERVRELSHRYLNVGPTEPARIVTLDELPTVLAPSASVAPAPAQTVTR